MIRTKTLFEEIECWLEQVAPGLGRELDWIGYFECALRVGERRGLSFEAHNEINRAWQMNQTLQGTDKLPIRQWAAACAAGHAADPAAALGFEEVSDGI